jgi:hypothetical protein
MKKKDLSVIILSYNTEKLLKNCLKSIFKSKLGNYSMEVIVVDNNSTDKSVEMVKNEFGDMVRLIESKQNLGYSGGNNLGLKYAQGRYILFLNSDTEVIPEAFKLVVNYMEENPQVGALTPKTILFSGGMDPDCHRGFPTPWASVTYFLGLEMLFPQSKLFGQYHQHYKDLTTAHEMDAGFGTFLLTRKKIMDKLGGWDDDYFFYGEDLDLFYRIKENGGKVVFYPKPIVTHYKGASSGLRKESEKMGVLKVDRKTRLRSAKESVRAMKIFYKKFYKDKYPKWVTFLILSAIKIKGFFRILRHQLK